jgi:hypothetical protein
MNSDNPYSTDAADRNNYAFDYSYDPAGNRMSDPLMNLMLIRNRFLGASTRMLASYLAIFATIGCGGPKPANREEEYLLSLVPLGATELRVGTSDGVANVGFKFHEAFPAENLVARIRKGFGRAGAIEVFPPYFYPHKSMRDWTVTEVRESGVGKREYLSHFLQSVWKRSLDDTRAHYLTPWEPVC